jgi:hypothetical protein
LGLTAFMLSCNSEDSASPNSGGGDTGKGGSMARFAITGNYLYAVDNSSINLFDISTPSKPVYKSVIQVGWGIETIYPYKNNLFLGSQTGMYIYDNSNPASPQFLSNYQHIYSCDPVVVNDKYAYVTLRNGSTCSRGANRLDIIDITDVKNPRGVAEYNMTNPYGLGIDDSTLFVCDDGLKVYDVTNPLSIKLLRHFKVEAYDVIPLNGVLMLIGKDGLYQYAYDNNNIELLSKLSLRP